MRKRRLFNSLGKNLFLVSRPLLILYFRLHPTLRVRVVVTDDHDNILLVKGWLSLQRWELPGGGIGKNESPAAAVRRELLEETGLAVDLDSLTELGIAVHDSGRLAYKVKLYSCRVPSLEAVRLSSDHWWEIIAVRFAPSTRLPPDTGRLVQRSLLRAKELSE